MAVGEEEEEAGRCDDGGDGCCCRGLGEKALAVARRSTSPDRTVEGPCLVIFVLCRVV